MSKLDFRQLVDMGRLQHLLEDLYRLTGVLTAVLDVEENVLVAVGWQDICTRFHRVHPESLARCRQSDAYIKVHLGDCPQGYVDYRCQNGLRDVAMPIIIGGRHLATFFTGQFFYDDDPPDIGFFKDQAAQFGFDEKEYLEALEKVPVVSRDHIDNLMHYCRGLVRMIAETGLKNLRLAREMEKRVQSEKEASFFRYLVENTRDPIYVLDPADGYRMFYANAAACAHYGMDREAVLKMRIPDWDPVFDMRTLGGLQKKIEEEKSVRFETIHKVASGKLVPVEVSAGNLEYEGRELVAGHFFDISERKEMEAALRESAHNLTEAQRIAKVGNWSWTLSGVLLSASRECRRILGTSAERFPGTEDAWLDMVCAEDRDRVGKAYAGLVHNLRPCSVEYRFRTPRGEEVTIRERREIVLDDHGQPAETVGTIQDITEQARLAEALREKDLLLMQQSRMAAMGEMISYIAHQWRQPLNIISLLVQNLEFEREHAGTRSSCRVRAVEQVMDLIEHMSSTIDDFRAFFRTDKEAEPFDLQQATRKIVNFIAADLAVHEIELDFEAAEGLIAMGYANEYSHVLLNILNNARDVLLERGIEKPMIRVRLFREGDKKVVTIRDNACGIPEDVIAKLFDPYFTTKKNGTGIGLYISKIIIEKHLNGSLTARNVEGGAEFRIEI